MQDRLLCQEETEQPHDGPAGPCWTRQQQAGRAQQLQRAGGVTVSGGHPEAPGTTTEPRLPRQVGLGVEQQARRQEAGVYPSHHYYWGLIS